MGPKLQKPPEGETLVFEDPGGIDEGESEFSPTGRKEPTAVDTIFRVDKEILQHLLLLLPSWL